MTQADPSQVKVDAPRGSGRVTDFFSSASALHSHTNARNLRGGLYEHFPSASCWLLRIVSCYDGDGLCIYGIE